MKLARSLRHLLVVSAISAAACSSSTGSQPADATATPGTRTEGALPRLVFFMNPNGIPCQMQDRILAEISGELSGRAELVTYRTTEPADLAQFGRYGVRSLPMLLLTDAIGGELRRATPGIQSASQIRRLVGR